MTGTRTSGGRMRVDSWARVRDRVRLVLGQDTPAAPRYAGFAVLFALSVVLGRLTVAPDSGVAMVWPASGIALVWFLTSIETEGTVWGRGATMVTAFIIAITTPLNFVSGMDLGRASLFAVGNAAAGFFGAYAYRRARSRPAVVLDRLPDAGALIVAAAATGIGSALYGPLYAIAVDGAPPALLWQAVTRNGIGALVVGGGLLRLLSGRPRVSRASRRTLAGLLLFASGCYWAAMVQFAHQPLSFLLTSVTVAAGVLLTVDGILVFVLAAGSVILTASVVGFGPFALVGSTAELFFAQAFIGVQATIGLVLTLAREDLARLVDAQRASRLRAEHQSELVGRVVGSMSEAVVAVEDGRVVLGNDATRRMFGLVPGMPVAGTALAGGGDEPSPLDRAVAGESVAADLSLEIDGESRVLSVWAHPIGRDRGHAVAVVRDVTDHRRQVADLSAFASVLAHDLLNPIGAVEGWLEVIDDESDADTDPVVVAATARATQGARRLREIVTGLHAYSVARGGELSMTQIDLQCLAERLAGGRVAAAGNTEGAVVPVCRVDARQVVSGDEALVAQVLDNLIGNAVKYTPPGAVPHITITAHAPVAGFVTVQVDDDGIGIPEEDREKVFEEFHRVGAHSKNYAGTGLGLAICRRMIERHGGTIRAERSPSGGTRMEFTLPGPVPGGAGVEGDTVLDATRAATAQGRAATHIGAETLRRSAGRASTP